MKSNSDIALSSSGNYASNTKLLNLKTIDKITLEEDEMETHTKSKMPNFLSSHRSDDGIPSSAHTGTESNLKTY